MTAFPAARTWGQTGRCKSILQAPARGTPDDEPGSTKIGRYREISSSSTAPLSPFLNSMMPLPSDRPTSGRRLPKRRTASPKQHHHLEPTHIGKHSKHSN